MQETIVTELENVEYGIWDSENDDFIIDPVEIEKFIDDNKAKVVAKALADSMKLFASDLKEALGKDLRDCYDRYESK
jgi:hypothetical protein